MTYEHKVQEFYDVARHCYEQIMGEFWHHADPEAVAEGLPRNRGCEIVHEKVLIHCGLGEQKGEGKLVLDFGSGIGGPTRHMARYTGASFIGVTNNERLNEDARARTAQAGLENKVSFRTLDDLGYKNLPWPDGTFDGATFYESVCHIPDKATLFKQLARVLKPGACVGGMDWIQRAFGEHQTEEQIMRFIEPVNHWIAIPGLGTVESYKRYMEDAGLEVFVAHDMFPNAKCWGAVQTDENPVWLNYSGVEAEMFRKGEEALVAAREAGVFTVGMWAARKPI